MTDTKNKERPILFSPALAGKVHDGSKTQTRRVIPERILWKWTGQPEHLIDLVNLCRYGRVGDRLYVRESVCKTDFGWVYRADQMAMYGGRLDADSERCRKELGYRWKPGIHMPRAACRTVVELTEVRVERVEDISMADALAEGMTPTWNGESSPGVKCPNEREQFLDLFYRINKRAPVGSNAWVWVLTFRKVEPHD